MGTVQIYSVWDQEEWHEDVLRQHSEQRTQCSAFCMLQERRWSWKLWANMLDDQAQGEWELLTLEDMRWNDNHQHPIKFWCLVIIKSMRCLIWQPAYATHLKYAPQRCFRINTPPKHLYIEMRTVDWWWETQVRTDT